MEATIASMFAPVANPPALRFAALCHRGPEDSPVKLVMPRLTLPSRPQTDRRVSDSPWG